MIHIAIVEDEKRYAAQLTEYIQRYQQEQGQKIKITYFADGEDIVEDYKGEYDIILLDIQMQFMDGMTAAERIREMDPDVTLMFITNMTQYAIRGYEVDAMDYVVKPVEYFAFSRKLDKAIEKRRGKDRNYITVPVDGGFRKLDVDDIYYIESQGHNAIYRTRTGEYSSRAALKELEEELGAYGFFRCAKGYLINMKLLEGVSEGNCIVHGEQIPISRSKKKEFMERLLLSMNKGDI